jgi:hypothetical protein
MVLGLQHWAQVAQKITRRAADIKPWRVRTNAAKALQERAQELAAGRGYIIATDAEIFAEFCEFCPAFKWAKERDEKKRIRAIKADFVRGGFAVFSVVCVR